MLANSGNFRDKKEILAALRYTITEQQNSGKFPFHAF
jgi:hypothetical protein